MNPRSSVDAVRATYVVPTDPHEEKKRRGHLTDVEKYNLIDVLFRTKQALMGADCSDITSRELRRFLKDVFHTWDSTRAHQLPDSNATTSSMKDEAVAAGRLNKDDPTVSEIKAEAKRRNLSAKASKSRAFKKIREEWNVQTANIHRRASAQAIASESPKILKPGCQPQSTMSMNLINQTAPEISALSMKFLSAKLCVKNFQECERYSSRLNEFVSVLGLDAKPERRSPAQIFIPSIRPSFQPERQCTIAVNGRVARRVGRALQTAYTIPEQRGA